MLAEAPFFVLDTFNRVDDAIDSNADIADSILACGLEAFGLPPDPDPDSPRNWHNTATASDVSKAHTTMRQFYRDWSTEGRIERDVCYEPVLQDLRDLHGDSPKPGIRVLVPGAGLGRLVFNLCLAGFSAEGNEISYHQLLASSWVLNHTSRQEEYALYPFALQFSNIISRRQQLTKVMIPDVHPRSSVLGQATKLGNGPSVGTMSVSAADFLVLYSSQSHKDSFHAVATVFFIDTAPNLIRYVETVRNCLIPGGAWINIGPLLWHFEANPLTSDRESGVPEGDSQRSSQGIGEAGRVELTEEEVLQLIERMGFRILKRDTQRHECGYIQDPQSMLQSMYRLSHWVAIKDHDDS
jgi:hypothetical protein